MTRSRLADALISLLVPPFAIVGFILLFLLAILVHAYYALKRWAEKVYKP